MDCSYVGVTDGEWNIKNNQHSRRVAGLKRGYFTYWRETIGGLTFKLSCCCCVRLWTGRYLIGLSWSCIAERSLLRPFFIPTIKQQHLSTLEALHWKYKNNISEKLWESKSMRQFNSFQMNLMLIRVSRVSRASRGCTRRVCIAAMKQNALLKSQPFGKHWIASVR